MLCQWWVGGSQLNIDLVYSEALPPHPLNMLLRAALYSLSFNVGGRWSATTLPRVCVNSHKPLASLRDRRPKDSFGASLNTASAENIRPGFGLPLGSLVMHFAIEMFMIVDPLNTNPD